MLEVVRIHGRSVAASILLGVTAALLTACAHAKEIYATTCSSPKVTFVIGIKQILAGSCSDEYVAQPTETIHVGQRIQVTARAGEAMPFSDDQRVLREISRTRDRRTAEYQAVRPGTAGLDIHYGPPCPDAEATGESTSPRFSGTDVCALLALRVLPAK
ncbi:hypothetical protein [Actinoallomurus rhizosphaericola]|uniref:hypothetical protein n=1 Tax=Actinoallomurus rhizosphaericola TaxID=2952536 RepID=UPI002092535B|nr:hypothetical protein [Actinoallomurus rhizosphaericola]MCO5996293.1 hypothetical protein [Actinoallomurus rhizosphaericola]